MRLRVQFASKFAVFIEGVTAVHDVLRRWRSWWLAVVKARVELFLQELVQRQLGSLLRGASRRSRALLGLMAEYVIV